VPRSRITETARGSSDASRRRRSRWQQRTKFQRLAETAAYTGKYMQAIISREGPRSQPHREREPRRAALSFEYNIASPSRQTLDQQVEQTIVIAPDFAFVMHADERGCSNAGGQASPATIATTRSTAVSRRLRDLPEFGARFRAADFRWPRAKSDATHRAREGKKEIPLKKIPSVTSPLLLRPRPAALPELTMGRGSRARGIKCSRTPARLH